MSFLQKKNLKAKKGKQKWRKNLDLSNLQVAISEQPAIPLQKPKKVPRFFIDPTPSEAIQRSLPKDRFKKKNKGVLSNYTKKQIKKKTNSGLLLASKKETKEPNEKINDAWNVEENKVKKDFGLRNGLPAAGQSYNPSLKDHKGLLQEILDQEVAKNDIKHAVSNKLKPKTTGKPAKSRSPSKREYSHQFHLLKKFNKEINGEVKKSELTKKKRLEKKELEAKMQKQGRLLRVPRLGKNKYQEKTPDFKLSNELSANLRNIKQEGDNLRDAFDKVYRKGLIEPGNPFAAKKKIRKAPRYKYHRGHDVDHEEKTLGTEFNIYNY